jgi:hypothetical protein
MVLDSLLDLQVRLQTAALMASARRMSAVQWGPPVGPVAGTQLQQMSHAHSMAKRWQSCDCCSVSPVCCIASCTCAFDVSGKAAPHTMGSPTSAEPKSRLNSAAALGQSCDCQHPVVCTAVHDWC